MADTALGVDEGQRTAARVAALAYLIPVAFVVYANFGIRDRLLVRSDMAETLRRVAASASAFRLSVAFDLVYCVGVVVLLAALYTLLRHVSRHLTILASALKLVYAMTAVLMVLSYQTAFRLATEPVYANALTPEALQALVRLTWFATGQQYYVGLLFWSLSSTVFGWLWLKSRYIPAPLAVAGIVSATWCVLCTIIYIIQPGFARVVNLWWFDSPFALVDITLSVWLLTKGLPGEPLPLPASATARDG
jgi:hypothetical protein